MTAVELVPMAIPDDVDAPEGKDFRTGVEIRNRLQPLLFGDQAIIATPAQVLPGWQDQTDEQVHPFLIRADGEAVGRALLYVPTGEARPSPSRAWNFFPSTGGGASGVPCCRASKPWLWSWDAT